MRFRAVTGSGLAPAALIPAALALSALILSGCSSVDGTPTVADSERAGMSTSTSSTAGQDGPSDDIPGSSSPTSSDEPSSTGSTSGEGIYLKVVRQGGAFSDVSDSDLIEQGEKACADLRSGKKFLDVVDDVEVAKGDISNGARLVGVAVGAMCPDQTDKISS
ncbi:DUF732 domain-containing protein [Gordonia liuliyuniae]|uniref:DUF732 domain-containing protein n=1 Tax=Gordonia liuliyuniae TaxID=2911517 RepID=A0ABS9ISH1_9ACTN|nr:DUF732 domain-containing protein [Gordonia liuliyuniae]MCF8588510.1 DUF732 domain-containing protein [Gordonia liuliyuniae]